MSDDTPTERFDPRDPEGSVPPKSPVPPKRDDAGDAPTEMFDAQSAAAEGPVDDAQGADAAGPENAEIQDPGAPVVDTPTERFPAADTAPFTSARGGYSGPIDTYNPDAPTERFDPTGGGAWPPVDQPTRILPTAAAAPRAATPPPVEPPRKSRALLGWLIGLGIALLVALIVIVWLFVSGGNDAAVAPTPSATATATQEASPAPVETEEPEPEPEPTASETEAPPVASPTFATFTAPSSAGCEEGDDNAGLSFSWSSSNAVSAYLGVGTQNAALNPTVSDLPPTATYTDLEYDCSVASQVYTVTLEDASGGLASRTVTITR